jgi:hypothetical protein
MARFIAAAFFIITSALFQAGAFAAETRTFTETVSVKLENDDEFGALQKAKTRATEKALRSYLDDVYRDRKSTPDLTGDDKYVQDLEVLESKVEGMFSKELIVRVKVTINEEEVRGYLKRQGAVVGKNDDRRIVVMLIPGKIDSGDAPVVLDYVRAEVRKSLAAAEYTVIDSDDQAIQDTLTEEADYNKLVAHINKISDQLADRGEWLVLAKVDMNIVPSGGTYAYHAMMTGKAVSLANRGIIWEGNIDGVARAPKSEAKEGLRLSAMDGGKVFAGELLSALNRKTLTQERMGSRYEVVFAANGDFKLESRFLKLLKEDIKGLKNVSAKNRGKKGSSMVVDLFYVGKIDDLVETLLAGFEKDSQLARFSPEIEGNKVIFR